MITDPRRYRTFHQFNDCESRTRIFCLLAINNRKTRRWEWINTLNRFGRRCYKSIPAVCRREKKHCEISVGN